MRCTRVHSRAPRPGSVSIATNFLRCRSVTSHTQSQSLLFMLSHIDLVLVFKAASPSPAPHFSKQRARQDVQDAEDQYTRLLTTLRNAGLHAVGRRGEHQ